MAIHVSNAEKPRLRHITQLLDALNLYTEQRAAVLLVLTDTRTPNPHSRLKKAGLPLSAGAGTQRVFRPAAAYLGRAGRIDREQRDYVFPQLMEVGILEPALILRAKDRPATGQFIDRGRHEPKSGNNIYVVTDDAWQLLMETPDKQWTKKLSSWLASDKQRRLRVAERTSSTQVLGAGQMTKHAKLIRACVRQLQESIASDFTLIYLDDSDGARVRDEFVEPLERAGLTPDLESKWPDAILVNEGRREAHFVDAVTTDGEFDTTRAVAVTAWAESKGWEVAGLTTAYETWKRAAARQANTRNLAVGSHLWIAEDGGKLFTVSSLA